jgi:hypothetical protein
MSRRKRAPFERAHVEALLEWLHKDREEAGRGYERLRRRLEVFFAARSETARYATDLADVTMDRAGRKVYEDPSLRDRDPFVYCLAVARLVALEFLKTRIEQLAFDPVDQRTSTKDDWREVALDRCLEELQPSDREAIRDYYRYEGGARINARKQAAAASGASSTAYKVRIFRIRRKLADCLLREARLAVTKPDSEPQFRRAAGRP